MAAPGGRRGGPTGRRGRELKPTEPPAGGDPARADPALVPVDQDGGYEGYARALVEAVEAVLPGWVERSVAGLVIAYRGRPDPEVGAAASRAGLAARADLVPRLGALVEADVDAQATTPLSLLREAVRYPAQVLREAGVPPVVRDDFAQAAFPDDDYGLTPASWSEVDPGLAEPGLAWGAAKALAHRRRHGA